MKPNNKFMIIVICVMILSSINAIISREFSGYYYLIMPILFGWFNNRIFNWITRT